MSTWDNHLKEKARKNTEYGFGRAYVAVVPGQTRIWGYYTVSTIHLETYRKDEFKDPPTKISMALMGRLAVDVQAQRRGIGELLMAHMTHNVIEASERIGIHAIFVEAKDPNAKRYYLSYDFIPLMDNPLHLYLPLNRARP